MIAEPARAQFLASSAGPLEIRINGRSAFRRDQDAEFRPDSDRFEADLDKGLNRIIVTLAATRPVAFHVRFRTLSSSAEHERIIQLALQNEGNAERGREHFLNAEKSVCLKCHRFGEQGNTIGPDLTGIGGRFSRIHIVESILEPSRTIAPSYESTTVLLSSGRAVSGVKLAEGDSVLVLGDEKGDRHEIQKSDIDERSAQQRSTMPDGLEKKFTDAEFLDLVTFLVSQKKLER
jgi:putative heme-binding domain-containing protein